jgi:hypothetical protein
VRYVRLPCVPEKGSGRKQREVDWADYDIRAPPATTDIDLADGAVGDRAATFIEQIKGCAGYGAAYGWSSAYPSWSTENVATTVHSVGP